MKHFSKFLNETYHAKDGNVPKRKVPLVKVSQEKQKSDIQKDTNFSSFMRSGLVVLSVILLASIATAYSNKAIGTNPVTAVFSNKISNKELPIYCVDTPDKKVALSFDAAWGNEDTQKILDILKKNDVHVTFFMTGGWVESYPDDVKAIAKAGHELGNHSENHKQMSTLSAEECKEEIMKVHEKVKELTGTDMHVFRPPYGDYNDNLIKVTRECNYNAIQWDVDSLDWKDYGADSILNTVLNHKHLGNGSIILCHNGAKYTAQALDQLIKGLKEKGFTLVTMSELIYEDNYEMDVEGRQHQKSASGTDSSN